MRPIQKAIAIPSIGMLIGKRRSMCSVFHLYKWPKPTEGVSLTVYNADLKQVAEFITASICKNLRYEAVHRYTAFLHIELLISDSLKKSPIIINGEGKFFPRHHDGSRFFKMCLIWPFDSRSCILDIFPRTTTEILARLTILEETPWKPLMAKQNQTYNRNSRIQAQPNNLSKVSILSRK